MATLQQIQQALFLCLADLPQQIGTLAVNFSKQRFVEQNWHDTAPEPWTPRRHLRRGGKRRQNGAILVDSGRLKRSIRIVAVTPTSVTIGTDVPYAQIHNDGFNGSQSVRAHTQRVKEHQRKQKVKGKKGKWKTKKVTVKAHTRNIKAHTRNMKMPRRRFLGSSAELEKQIMELIMSEINAAISNL